MDRSVSSLKRRKPYTRARTPSVYKTRTLLKSRILELATGIFNVCYWPLANRVLRLKILCLTENCDSVDAALWCFQIFEINARLGLKLC